MQESKTSKRKLNAADLETQALELRKAGKAYREIGAALGVPLSTAAEAVYRALRKLNEQSLEKAEEVRRMELERLDVMLAGLWDAAREGDPALIDRVLRIMERRSRYLGLDAPTKAEHDIGMRLDPASLAPDERRALLALLEKAHGGSGEG